MQTAEDAEKPLPIGMGLAGFDPGRAPTLERAAHAPPTRRSVPGCHERRFRL